MKAPCPPPDLRDIIRRHAAPEFLAAMFFSPFYTDSPNGKYLHWDKLRYKKLPVYDWSKWGGAEPSLDAKKELWWLGVKSARSGQYKEIAHYDKDGKPFVYATPDIVLRLLHGIDILIGKGFDAAGQSDYSKTGERHLVNSLFEESIASSQLEGAATTREAAKEILRQSKKPLDISQRMIVNNYRAIQFVDDIAAEELTPEMVLDIHRIIAEGTLENADSVGRLRQRDDIVVRGAHGGAKYVPPQAKELEHRLVQLCAFANNKPADTFLHPVVHAIILHFLLAYDHPFEDGNGRTARALFYYLLLRSGYRAIQYISISRILKRAPVQYARAYLYTESDDNDVTYFIIHQLEVVTKAIDELFQYWRAKRKEMENVRQVAESSARLLNDRQTALLGKAIRKPDSVFSIEGHRSSHGIAYQSARTDLMSMVSLGLLVQRQSGKAFMFMPVKRLKQKLQSLSRQSYGTP